MYICTYVRTHAHMYIQEIRKRCSTPRAFFCHQLKYTVSCISHLIAHCIIKRLVLKSKVEAGECGTVIVLVHLLEESSKLVPKAVHYVKGTYAHTHTYVHTCTTSMSLSKWEPSASSHTSPAYKCFPDKDTTVVTLHSKVDKCMHNVVEAHATVYIGLE